MADETIVSEETIAAAAVSTPQGVAPEQNDKEDKEQIWLKERLDRARETERRSILKELGVEDVKNAKEALSALKQLRDAQKTEEERLRAQVAELQSAVVERDAYKSKVEAQAKAAIAQLSEQHQAIVAELAGDSPAKQLETIEKLKSAGMLVSKPAPIAAPTQTAPAQAAPAPGSTKEDNVLATWDALRADPRKAIEAAYFRLQHLEAISNAAKARR